MPLADDPAPSHPMLKVYSDIGTITQGIKNLEKGQDKLGQGQEEVEKKISGLYRNVGNLVTKDECSTRHPLGKHLTPESPMVGTPSLLQRAADNAGNITKILTLVASLVIGLWAVHKFSTRLEATLARAEVQTEKTTQKLIKSIENQPEPRVVYVPVPASPDAGLVQPRRPRRIPRRPARKRATP